MSWLLKVVEGPMKGAEIALVSGFKVKVGSSDACEIVIADGALAAEAFELDVTDESVSLVEPSSAPRPLPAFEIVDFGTTSIAVGPAEGAWGPLVRPERKPGEPAAEAGDAASGGTAKEAASDGAAADESATAESSPAASRRRRRGFGCLVWLLVLVLLGVAVWYFWLRIAARYPRVEEHRVAMVAQTRSWGHAAWERVRELCGAKPEVVVPVKPVGETLAEIAAAHGLASGMQDGRNVLSGNVSRRTERLAIRALALAADPGVVFDLTDDETLRTASEELLFVATEGALRVVAASNRVVEIAGYAPTAQKLEQAIRSLNQDVPGIERLETRQVRVGGQVPHDMAHSAFATGTKPTANAPSPVKATKHSVARDFPIAGILMHPYPCVVMRGGMRLAVGAQLGTASLVRIEADRLILRDGHTTFEWKP